MRPSDEQVLGHSRGDEITMGEYGPWMLIEQKDEFSWWAKGSDRDEQEFATILFFPGMEPGFAPPKPLPLPKKPAQPFTGELKVTWP